MAALVGHCIFLCGEWASSVDGVWRFEVDKFLVSRVVPLSENVTLAELEDVVILEFGVLKKKACFNFSPPNSMLFTTGERTPPVLVTTDVGLDYFNQLFRENRHLNMFVNFQESRNRGPNTDELNTGDRDSFVSGRGIPLPGKSPGCSFGSSDDDLAPLLDAALGSQLDDVVVAGLSEMEENFKIGVTNGKSGKRVSAGSSAGCSFGKSGKRGKCSFYTNNTLIDVDVEMEGTVGSKSTIPIIPTTQVDPSLLAEVDEIESKYWERGCYVEDWSQSIGNEAEGIVEDCGHSSEEEEDTEEEEGPTQEILTPTDYDREFWGNFVGDHFGRANPVEIMCTTNDCFDHRVVVNGGTSLPKDEKFGMDSGGVFGLSGDPAVSEPVQSTVTSWTHNGGQEQIPAKPKRRLDDGDDEEFDIPPLFDDIEYERDEIPDLYIDDDDKDIYQGKKFANKEDCQIGLAIYAIKKQFHFKQTRTKRDYFVLKCSCVKCDWRIMAKELSNGYYEIHKACLEHTCPVETRCNYMKKATSRVISAVFKAQFSDPSKSPVPIDLQQLVLEDLMVSASYCKCRRAREKATDDLFGSDEDSYDQLAEYLHLLKVANLRTVTDIKTEIDEDGTERFLYTFLAFGASIQGFSKLRRVLVVDRTHLTGKYKGVLLTASGQDGNFQVFPLAFAVVDSENDDSWTWFFEKLERIIADNNTLTIIFDRCQSIYVAKKRVFPLSHHVACIVHLARNVNAKFHNKGLAKLVTNAAYAFTVGSFRTMYGQIRGKNIECAKWLDKIGAAHWSRAYFQGDRYNLMTSNIAESLNKALWKGRASPIVELLKFIRAMLSRWFSARRKKSARHNGW